MIIEHDFLNERFIYRQLDEEEVKKLSFILLNKNLDHLNLGVAKNCSKFQGWIVRNPNSLRVDLKFSDSFFKILDEIVLSGLEVKKIINSGYSVSRVYGSKYCENIDDFEVVKDSFFIVPSGLIYEVSNYEGDLIIDIDIRRVLDFDKWGRNYKVYGKGNSILIKYSKFVGDDESYSLYVGISSPNFNYQFIREWVKKEYGYSKKRGSSYEFYVYRLLISKVFDSRRVFFTYGDSEEEVLSKLKFLEVHYSELINFERELFNKFSSISSSNFSVPVTLDILNAYKLSSYNLYRFLDLNSENPSFIAGIPWFLEKWSRDNLVALRGLINNGDFLLSKRVLKTFLDAIDVKNGLMSRIISERGSFKSVDSVFWFSKRLEDLIYRVSSDGVENIDSLFSIEEISEIFNKLYFSFNGIISECWDSERELLRVKCGDSWMDTIVNSFPLDIQVQFLSFVSTLRSLSLILKFESEESLLYDFEVSLKRKIASDYFKDGFLYSDLNHSRIDCNIFLAYYLYPDLFEKSVWERIFDKSIPLLRANWGGFASLNRYDPNFCEFYTGENDKSYHNGDSWFWINNLAGIVLNDLNPKKYMGIVSKVILSSTQDILRYGAIGFASEISSFRKLSAEGCFAQLWSISTYIELIDKVFKRRFNL